MNNSNQENAKMYTSEKVEVTEFINKGRTAFVKTIREAISLTKLRSYYYEVFDEKQRLVGYGIPK